MLTLQGIHKRYGRNRVLSGVDLTVPAGASAAIIGGNGSGKSTLLRIAVGATVPTAGAARRPARVGYVPERLPATLRMNATQYLLHMGRIRGLDTATIRGRATDLLDRLGLVPGPDVPIGTLSKGNNQKVAIAQALLVPTELLVLDEPYSGLDGPAAAECTALIEEARGRGAAVVVSAHSSAAAPPTDRRFELSDGRINAGERPAMRVVLRAVEERAAIAELARVPGVRSVGGDPAAAIVLTEDADELLRYALMHGWSLQEARG
ncbi:MAG TPA: ABC transporter ATP-binding protein [Mycobacteriales bacterium]|nr:ABC transporter ATP-binding protein [Mycobacteriales bacterium]